MEIKEILKILEEINTDVSDKIYGFYEHSFRKDEIYSRIQNQAENLFGHLYKYYVYPDSIDISHWCDEIAGSLRLICNKRFKGSNRKVKDATIISELRSVYYDAGEMNELIFDIQKEYGRNNADDNLIYDKIIKALKKLIAKAQNESKLFGEDVLETLKAN